MSQINAIIIDMLAFSLPLFIMAIGGIFSERSGVTNLALEGLQGFGAFGGAFIAVILTSYLNMPVIPTFFLSLFAACIFAGLYAGLHALVCLKFKANQVISGVVINILAQAVTAFLTKHINSVIFKAPSDKFILNVTPRFSIPFLEDLPLIGGFCKNIYAFQPLIIVMAIFAYVLLYKTRFGLSLRACGENPYAVDAAGLKVNRIRTVAVILSGVFSGIAGMAFAYSIATKFSASNFAGYGYLAIAALIFGNWKVMPTLFACLIFGFARSLGYFITLQLQLPSAYSDLIQILPYATTLVLLIFFSKQNAAPSALGKIYNQEER